MDKLIENFDQANKKFSSLQANDGSCDFVEYEQAGKPAFMYKIDDSYIFDFDGVNGQEYIKDDVFNDNEPNNLNIYRNSTKELLQKQGIGISQAFGVSEPSNDEKITFNGKTQTAVTINSNNANDGVVKLEVVEPKNKAGECGGVFITSNDQTPNEQSKISDYIVLEKILINKNLDNTLQFRIVNPMTNKYAFLNLSREHLECQQELRKLFQRKGVNLSHESRHKQVFFAYIDQSVKSKSNSKEFVNCTNKVGWDNDVFCTPEQTFYPKGYDGQKTEYFINSEIKKNESENEDDAVNHFQAKGTLQEWQDNVSKHCSCNTRLQLAICTALASPLLKLLHSSTNFGVEIIGNGSQGKSTALEVACSVYGNPKVFKRQWRVTNNGLEAVLEKHNDCLLALDEVSQIDEKQSEGVAYLLGNGQGKTRANVRGDAREQKTWRTIVFSTGEQSLHDITKAPTKSGEAVRILTVPAVRLTGHSYGVFETVPYSFKGENDKESGANFSKLLIKNSRTYYGTVGKHWLQYLVNNKQQIINNGTRELKLYEKGLIAGRKLSSVQLRVASQCALLVFAGELATQIGLTCWKSGEAFESIKACFDDWLDWLGGATPEEAEIIETISLLLDTHEARFEHVNPTEDKIIDNRVGYYDDEPVDDDKTLIRKVFLFTTQQFKKHVCGNYKPLFVCNVLAKHGYLKVIYENKKGVEKYQRVMKKPSWNNDSRRVYQIFRPQEK